MGASENPCEEVCVGGLGEGENYIWCLVIVAIFMGLGGPKRCGGGGLKSSYRGSGLGKSQNGRWGWQFLWGRRSWLH